MKLLNAEVDWMWSWDNDPYLKILVDRIPENEELRYRCHDWCWYAELDGYVSFFSYVGPSDGFYGRGFELTMIDGSKKVLVGPWSSRAGAVNQLAPPKLPPVMDVAMTDDEAVWHRGYTFYSGHCTVDLVQEWLDEHIAKPIWKLVKEESNGGDIVWQPRMRTRHHRRAVKKIGVQMKGK